MARQLVIRFLVLCALVSFPLIGYATNRPAEAGFADLYVYLSWDNTETWVLATDTPNHFPTLLTSGYEYSFMVSNSGTTTINEFDLNMDFDGFIVNTLNVQEPSEGSGSFDEGTGHWTGVMPPNDSVRFEFSVTLDGAIGTHNICGNVTNVEESGEPLTVRSTGVDCFAQSVFNSQADMSTEMYALTQGDVLAGDPIHYRVKVRNNEAYSSGLNWWYSEVPECNGWIGCGPDDGGEITGEGVNIQLPDTMHFYSATNSGTYCSDQEGYDVSSYEAYSTYSVSLCRPQVPYSLDPNGYYTFDFVAIADEDLNINNQDAFVFFSSLSDWEDSSDLSQYLVSNETFTGTTSNNYALAVFDPEEIVNPSATTTTTTTTTTTSTTTTSTSSTSTSSSTTSGTTSPTTTLPPLPTTTSASVPPAPTTAATTTPTTTRPRSTTSTTRARATTTTTRVSGSVLATPSSTSTTRARATTTTRIERAVGTTTTPRTPITRESHKPFLLLGDLSLTGSNVWDMVLLGSILLLAGLTIYFATRKEKEEQEPEPPEPMWQSPFSW